MQRINRKKLDRGNVYIKGARLHNERNQFHGATKMNKLLAVQVLAFTLCSVYGQHLQEAAQLAESGLTGAVQAGSKYFQDIYAAQVSPELLEFGHVRETADDWEQRFEQINLNSLKQRGKVRWGDKNGGYGEHYWDYNHAGGHGADGHDEEESQNHESYEPYEEEVDEQESGKRQRRAHEEVELVDHPKVSRSLNQKHGGNYRKLQGNYERTRRQNA
ncbi:PREDICTED: uncharacterized protein LOC108561142 isoform X1 [Nicrophorus vespilloides]|uniref:Uncharacterized protein LOC108561142 isoform X1 n=1 Tax=Nicrophorus vespilloides TaxID=110193 RepID=A0ABM1MIP3_NICVS|nr:PREDICTED: uncharacterized protein LOC108561142 isoform X1 [Nicrophorus vespilloides]XP_017774444.1 PREDICTED: uncharacterized protein LOC108561142 isoform X1 [Nicrophorus vespilloides]